ncbi:rhomboid family intramembrane serine protease [Patulibacter minatonensis]|uniref:rhomboid family intramembrane serine protease n=1 Tax=Patulibacter minatonensis TaxID=298163 RepID=UPI000A06E8B8|nr:rhomboid family intramembrane serine protease [Patulibacter minatonensis]
MATCYRHPARETGVSCSNCDRPICPDCMTSTPVGMRCPECAKQRTKVHTISSVGGGHLPRVTQAIIGICIVAFLAGGNFGLEGTNGSWIDRNGVLFRAGIEQHDYWRLVTSGFLHAGLIHIAFNMLLLWFLGSEIEGKLGGPRFALLYLVALLGGSLGAMIQTTNPLQGTVGASGAVFGLAGYLLVEMRRRGENPFQSQLGFLLLINLVLSFRPGVSWGGHLGGLVFGALAAFVLYEGSRRGPRWLGPALCGGLCVVAVIGSIVVAGSSEQTVRFG